ncbi:predicted protein [Aspergillus terreus NIH2624]|uniref:Uncharacterized protein n=1 Tax=Aspergillus terreus (strain NIH 2624 / FGSC A1156) TaxID=341663 RepID=Q0CDU1_ASPTN|nr:uncharacterized protein ATEG_08143 [Aspergillus terreus NIH2624]EAU31316.1 predicted protein [Aspergillus terreus NIH2624]
MAGVNRCRTGSAQIHVSDGSADLLDTALPPMSSKQLVTTTATRRAVRGSESSIVMGGFRGNQKAAAALGLTPESMPSVVARSASSHRRTGSTIKTVMRKIFTRKRRSETDSFDDDIRFSNPPPQRVQKDPPPDSGLAFHNSLSSKHSSPLNNEFDASISLSDALDRLHAGPPRRRRATLPSLIFSDGDDESRDALDAVVHPHHGSNDDIDDDHHHHARRQMKRRSRSATALRGLARNHRMSPIQWRRRSLESYMTMTVASDSELSPRPPTRTTVASAPKPSTASIYDAVPSKPDINTDTDPDTDDAESVVIPPDVGTLVAMQGDNDTDNVSLAQRLTTLEVKMIDLEFAIARMQSGRPSSPSPTPDRVPKPQQPEPKHRPRPSASGTTTPSEDPADNRLSASTIRPSTTPTPTHSSAYARPRMMHTPSMTSLNDGAGISVEQYSALVMLLRREQTARRTLESEVSSLREDIQALQRLAMGSGPGPGAGGGAGSTSRYPSRSAESSEFLRLRSAPTAESRSGSGSGSAGRSTRSPYESSASDETEGSSAGFRSRWQSTRRVEVGGMI